MNKYNSIAIAPVRSLEVGDLIALPAVGNSGVIGGKVTGLACAVSDLTKEQRAYMFDRGMEIPHEEGAPIGGPKTLLIFGEFSNHPNHIFLDFDRNVAVFPPKE